MAPEEAARAIRPEDLARDGLRTQAVAELASQVATIPEVRTALVAFQKDFAQSEGGAVLDGRDIGTVICPDADVKLFVTASEAARAHRRWLELKAAGHLAEEAEVLNDVRARDARDASRDAAPMVAAADATIIDTSEMSIEEAVAAAEAVVSARLKM